MLNPNLVFHERCANKLCTISWHIFLCTMSRHLSTRNQKERACNRGPSQTHQDKKASERQLAKPVRIEWIRANTEYKRLEEKNGLGDPLTARRLSPHLGYFLRHS